MEIKGEANAFKLEVAKNLKKLAKKISVIFVKKESTTKIVIQDNRATNVNINFFCVAPPTPQQIQAVTERASQLLKEQAGIIEVSGDKAFDSLITQGIASPTVSVNTAGSLFIKNNDYLIEGEGHPVFIKNFKNLPYSVQFPPSKQCSQCGKLYHPTMGELSNPPGLLRFDVCPKCRSGKLCSKCGKPYHPTVGDVSHPRLLRFDVCPKCR